MTMFWFRGSINEAINKSKDEKKVFVVFVNGNDDISRQMDNHFESLSTNLSELPLVAIKLESQSDNCKLFSQIYPVILIPSTYFIDYNGVAIEIIGGSVENKEVLIEKINKTIEIYKKSLPSNESEDTKELQTNEKLGNSSKTSAENELTTTATTSGTQSIATNDSITETSNVSQTASIEEKVKRANHLIEALREKKAKEEAEKEKEEETERRKSMKEMQQAKRLREDKEAMDIIKEREREKKEEKLARDRVLAQIAADKEERRKRQMEFSGQQTAPQTSVETNDSTQVRQRIVSDKSRIQFRLPDGSTSNHIFESNDSLQTVSQFVSSNFKIRSFILSTTFPRKEFPTEDYCKTLEELCLCPSSVLLVISRGESSISRAITSPSIIWQIVTYLSLPLVMIWNLMTSFFSRSTDATTTTTTATTEAQTKRLPQKKNTKTFSNREGNIARISDQREDSDSDNNTWNGNSTQQM